MHEHQRQDSRRTLNQSKRLPYWLWYIVAKSLGIKTHPRDKPWFSTVLYCIMLTSLLMYNITMTWYVVFDIKALNTKYDVLNGAITLGMAFGFSAASVYANKLAYRLFTNHIFLQSVRLHSKTVFSVNASLVLSLIGALFVGLYSYQTFENLSDDYCTNIDLSPWICRLRWPSQVGLSLTSFGWNAMVAVIMLSVCRTHTISIRHFILILEEDSLVYELKRAKQAPPVNDDGEVFAGSTATAQTSVIPTEIDEQDADLKDLEEKWDQSIIQGRRRSVSSHFHSLYSSSYQNPPTLDVQDVDSGNRVHVSGTEATECTQQEPHIHHSEQTAAWLNASGYSHAPMSVMLTNDEILDRYWKLQSRLATTSRILQRWLSSWIILILFWSTYYLLYWIDHDATILDMILFFVPLVLLPVLCSGPTEVNGEGMRVPRSIVPTEERLRIINFIKQSPLAITIFGFELNYATIVTTMAAIALAFATKVIISNIQVGPTSPTDAPSVLAVTTPGL